MELGQAKKIFLITKRSENVTARTLEIYEEVINRFFEHLIAESVYAVTEVNPNHIRAFLVDLQDKGLRGVTRHIYFRTLRTFFLFLYHNDYLTNNIMTNVKPPKIEHKAMRTFTSQEISKMLNSFNRGTFTGFRNYCMFCMFFSTGIRKGELVNLTLKDMNITNDFIRIANGKGQKERYVPIGRTMRRVLLQYVKMREEFLQGDSCDWLFVTHKDTHKITIAAINGVFHTLKVELKLTGEKISCHTWRHTMAKNYLLNGGDIFSLQKILGHSNITTTKGYLNLNEKEIQVQHAKYNPLDCKAWVY